VLALMAEGLGNIAIAERLFVSEGAVRVRRFPASSAER